MNNHQVQKAIKDMDEIIQKTLQENYMKPIDEKQISRYFREQIIFMDFKMVGREIPDRINNLKINCKVNYDEQSATILFGNLFTALVSMGEMIHTEIIDEINKNDTWYSAVRKCTYILKDGYLSFKPDQIIESYSINFSLKDGLLKNTEDNG